MKMTLSLFKKKKNAVRPLLKSCGSVNTGSVVKDDLK